MLMILVLYFILQIYVYGSHPLCHLAEKIMMNGGCCHLKIKIKIKTIAKRKGNDSWLSSFFYFKKMINIKE
jgi:hypothetical protein